MNNIYIALEKSVLVPNKQITLEDIASIFCTDPEIRHQVGLIKLHTFTNDENDYIVITVMKLIKEISLKFKDISVTSIGQPECIVYYRNTKENSRIKQIVKAIFLMILTFFGTAYSIMSYNGDVGTDLLLKRLYYLFTGIDVSVTSYMLLPGIIFYSLGLGLGMIIFFNHGLNHNSVLDPTPLQVQMRLYEEDVNQSIITDSSRKGKIIDVD